MVTKNIVVVNKGGDLKDVTFKDFDLCNLYKKCGFRKADRTTHQLTVLRAASFNMMILQNAGRDQG